MNKKMHHRAKLSDEQVKQMRLDYLAYIRGYGYLAKKYKCGISTARDICTYVTRYACK
jgi:hypothetical protein